MLKAKFLCTLVALGVAIIAICNFNSENISEGLGMLPSMTSRLVKVGARSQAAAQKGDFYSIPGTYQASLNPRFSNTSYGANIRYNMPAYSHQAAPCNPLTFGQMAKENYTREDYSGCGSCGSGCSAPVCEKGGSSKVPMQSPPVMHGDYADGNYNEMVDKAMEQSQYPQVSDQMPVQTMNSVNALGEEMPQPIVYDRLMFANRNSTLRSQGDWIRGDLPIVPCNTGWFQVSVNPNIDLNQGAMNVLCGLDNGTAQQMAALLNDTVGDTTIGGVNLTPQQLSSIGAGQNDLTVAAFP